MRNLNLKLISVIIFAITFLIGGFFISNITLAETSGPNTSKTATTDTGVGTVPWINPSNANTLDTYYTTSALTGQTVSNYLKTIDYGFNIPDNATILGIKVDISRKASLADRIKDTEVKIVKNGTIGATNKADVNNWSYPTESVVSYGGSSDLWDEIWTATDINSLNFGVVIAVENIYGGATNRTASINSVQITITYIIPTVIHTLAYTADANGSITGTSPQTIDQGLAGSEIIAVPNTGYHFTNWSDDVLTASRTDTNIQEDISVTANFAINTYTLTYTAGANGTITGTTSQTVDYGTDGTTVTAVANSGYHFVDWSDGGLTAERTDTNIQANKSVTANFTVNLANTKAITAFSFATPEATGVITGTNIAINVPHGTDVTALVPTITFSGTSVSPNTGVSQNFSSPVTYTVTAANDEHQDYVITVTILEDIQTKSRGSSGSYARPIIKAPVVNTTPVVGKVLGTEKFNFTRFIKFKMGSYKVKLQGNEVTELQKFLNTLGYTTLIVDGKFGPKTKGAVIKFQIANGLKGDGVVGPLTRAILNK